MGRTESTCPVCGGLRLSRRLCFIRICRHGYDVNRILRLPESQINRVQAACCGCNRAFVHIAYKKE